MSLDLLVMSVPNYQRQVPGEEFLQKYPKILGQIIKAIPLQRTIMELSCSLTIRDVEILRLGFWILELWATGAAKTIRGGG
jgi:hypothetical protein